MLLNLEKYCSMLKKSSFDGLASKICNTRAYLFKHRRKAYSGHSIYVKFTYWLWRAIIEISCIDVRWDETVAISVGLHENWLEKLFLIDNPDLC